VYKCLENPKILLVVLGLLQLGATAFVILDVIMTKGARRLTGKRYSFVFEAKAHEM
jgi:hypothetical protein